jgi:hypothetical protein
MVYPKERYEVPIPRIADAIEEIVSEQSPINIALVYKQVSPLYCNDKVTKRVKDGVLFIVKNFNDRNFIYKNDYLWLKGQNEIIPKIPANGEKPRPLDLVAPEELAKAMTAIIDKSYGIAKDSLFKVVAREYGFSRVTENMLYQLNHAFAILEKGKHIKNIDGKLLLIHE